MFALTGAEMRLPNLYILDCYGIWAQDESDCRLRQTRNSSLSMDLMPVASRYFCISSALEARS